MRVPEEGRGWRASQSTKQARVGLTEKVRSEQKIAGARQLAKQTAWKKIIPGRETAKAESESVLDMLKKCVSSSVRE